MVTGGARFTANVPAEEADQPRDSVPIMGDHQVVFTGAYLSGLPPSRPGEASKSSESLVEEG
jgi:hypothetical protein